MRAHFSPPQQDKDEDRLENFHTIRACLVPGSQRGLSLMGLAIPQVNGFYLIPRPLRAEGKDEILKRADRHACKADDTIAGLEARFLGWTFRSHARQFHPKSRRLGEIGDGPTLLPC
jgi:hypothetical protein